MIKKFSGLILYVLITVFVVTIYLDQPDILSKWEMTIYDKLFELRGKQEVTDDIQILAIDDISVQGESSWPWSRKKVAELVTKISQQHPQLIYLDLSFPDDPLQDSSGYTTLLANAIKKAGNVIIPYRYSIGDYSTGGVTLPNSVTQYAITNFDNIQKFDDNPALTATSLYLPTRQVSEAASAMGFKGITFDKDRYIRNETMILNHAGRYLPSVPFIIAQQYFKAKSNNVSVNIGRDIALGPRDVQIDKQSRMRINFNGPLRTFKYVSALDVMNDTIGKKDLAGKVILVAYTGTGTTDLYSTPVAKAMPEIEITANTVENIVHDHFLKGVGSAGMVNLLMIIAIGLFSAIILPRISLMYREITLGISLIVIANVSFVLFTNFDITTQVFYPVIMVLFFMVTAPMMKIYRSIATVEDEEGEIDYEALLVGTPLSGIQTNAHMPVGGSHQTSSRGFNTQPLPSQTRATSQTIPLNARTQSAASSKSATNFGRYLVYETIGQGAMGNVYRGLDPAIDRPVALKTIRLDNIVNQNEVFELKERLTREAKAAGQLSHPNIVTIYDVGEEQSVQYIAMEFLDGHTLESLINAKHQWDYKTLCKLVIQVCEALDFAHERGIVHRDIKPANIMLLGDDRVKVMDFGIARFDQSNMTQSGVALGTPNYISPEQLKGQPVDRRSDIFSLGVVFYELLTAQRPFKGDTISALIYSILHTNPAPPSELNLDVPRIFDKIVAKALAKDPDLRFQTAREMADILRKLI